MTKIKNIKNDSIHNNCNCRDWLEHWEKISGKTATVCCEKNCTNKDLKGAIVQKLNGFTENCYIIPLCSIHSTTDEVMEVLETMVNANRDHRCEEYIEMHNVG